MNIIVNHIPQDTEWNRSFNVLVPLEIQGKKGVLIQRGTNPTIWKGSMGHQISIDGKGYCVPSWAITATCI